MILRRLRAIAITAGLWAGAWAFAAIPYALIIKAFGVPVLRSSFLQLLWIGVQQFAITGAVAGAVFAIVFMAAERQRRIEEMSAKRIGLWGFLGGIAFPAFMILPWAIKEATAEPVVFAVGFGIMGLLGAACAVGTLALARRAPAPSPEPVASRT